MVDNKALFNRSIRRVRQNIQRVLTKKAKQFGDDTTKRLCQYYIQTAQKLLRARSNPDTASSSDMVIEDICHSFHIVEGESGYYVSLTPSFLGISNEMVLFLEYGTGVEGQENPHPEAGVRGWVYLTRQHPKAHRYSRASGREFWFFKETYSGTQYIDASEHIKRRYQTKRYVSTASNDYRISSGIKPTRFLYDARLIVKDTIKKYKTFDELDGFLKSQGL